MHPQRIRAKKNADQREALLKQARAERDHYRALLEQLISEVARKALTDSPPERKAA
jgi:DNA-directed RNA polymerase subunit L